MRGCDECAYRKGCTSRKLLRAVERECGVSVGVDGCDYRDTRPFTQDEIDALREYVCQRYGGVQMSGPGMRL